MDVDSQETTVDLFVRSAGVSVWESQEDAIERLDALEADGVVDECEVEFWGGEIALSGAIADTDRHRSAAATIARFESWAQDRARVELPFEHEVIDSPMLGATYRLVRTPILSLAVYLDGELSGVYPCTDEGDPCSVDEVLSWLERATEGSPSDDAVPDGFVSPTTTG